MNREDLIKGQTIENPILGLCKVLKICKKYVKLEQLDFSNIICKYYF